MNIQMGETIKRLRNQKNITQEELAVAMNVSAAAVSKWETGITLPDISLLPQLAYYFKVSIDELMNYSESKMEQDILAFWKKHTAAMESFCLVEALQLSTAAIRQFPNDYRVMIIYAWDLIGGCADNDTTQILKYEKELEKICERILSGCRDISIRLDALTIKGKLLHAAGKTEEAKTLYYNELPDMYRTAGQKCEQLFPKDSAEFAAQLHQNMKDLALFFLNKKSKDIWFCSEGSLAEKTNAALTFCRALKDFGDTTGVADIQAYISYFADDFASKLTANSAKASLIAIMQDVMK
ncbi:MAG: helix-turn-helix transcriptional regulator [Lachnospiraceae bacterium]|nr:helix-turn-helix transcriptional regulator [Lachnospiraceae bacterium]